MIINHILNWKLTIILSVSLLAHSCNKTKVSSPQESTSAESTSKKPPPPKATPQEKSGTAQHIEQPTKEPNNQKSDSTSKRTKLKPKATLPPPEVVTDPSAFNVEDGFPRPKPGDKIYTWDNIPNDACGEYWIKNSEGKISKVAVCRDQH